MFYPLWKVLPLLSIVYSLEVNFIADLVQKLDKAYHFESLTIFRGESLDNGQYDEFLVKLSENREIPRFIGTPANGFDLQYAINRNSLAVVFAADESDQILVTIQKSFKGRRTIRVIFAIDSPIDLNEFFQWAWIKQFIKPMVVRGNDAFSIDPYPTIRIINVTSFKSRRMFPKETFHFKGYKLWTPIQMDVPRVFWYEGKEIKHNLSGYGGRVVKYFQRFANIDIILERDNHTNFLDKESMLNFLEAGRTEIIVHPFMIFNRSLFGASYPLDLATYCLIQPLGPPIPKYMFIFLPFTGGVWMLVAIAFVFISITLSQLPLEDDGPFNFGGAAIVVISMIENLPTPYRRFNKFNSLRVIYMQLFLFGFILSNIYLALLASYLTLDVYPMQDDSFEALIYRQEPIMAPAYERGLIAQYNDLPKEFYKLFVEAKADEFTQYRNSLYTAYSYPITSDRWQFVSMQQMFLRRKLFRISTNMCFASFPLQFAMQYDSHLNRPLSYFITVSQESGLYTFWRRSAFRRALSMGYVKLYAEEAEKVEPLTLKFLTYILLVWGWGLMAGFVVFLIEVNAIKSLLVTVARLINKCY